MHWTDNYLEIYQNVLKSSLTCKHPKIWKSVSALKSEEPLAQQRNVEYDGTKICETKNNKNKDINKHLQLIME